MLSIFGKEGKIWRSYFIKSAAILGLIVGTMNASNKDPLASSNLGSESIMSTQGLNNDSSLKENRKNFVETTSSEDEEVNKLLGNLGNRVVELQNIIPRDRDIKQLTKETSTKTSGILWKVAKPALVHAASHILLPALFPAVVGMEFLKNKAIQKSSTAIVNKFFNEHYRKAVLHSIEYTAKVLQQDSYNIVKFLLGRDAVDDKGTIDEEFSNLQKYINDFSPWLLEKATHLAYDAKDADVIKKETEVFKCIQDMFSQVISTSWDGVKKSFNGAKHVYNTITGKNVADEKKSQEESINPEEKIYQEKLIQQISEIISDGFNKAGTEIANMEGNIVNSLCNLIENRIGNTLIDMLHRGVEETKHHTVKENILLRGVDFLVCQIMCNELSNAMSSTYFDDLSINSRDIDAIKTATELNAIPGVGGIAFQPLISNANVMFNVFDNNVRGLRKSAKDLLTSDTQNLERGMQNIDANIRQVKTEHHRFSSFIKQVGKSYYDNLHKKINATTLLKGEATTPQDGVKEGLQDSVKETPQDGAEMTSQEHNEATPIKSTLNSKDSKSITDFSGNVTDAQNLTEERDEKITSEKIQGKPFVNPFITHSMQQLDTLWYDVMKDCLEEATDKQGFIKKILFNTSRHELLMRVIADCDASANSTQLSNLYLDCIVDAYENTKSIDDSKNIERINFFQRENITKGFIELLSKSDNDEKIQTISNIYIRAIMQRSFTKDYTLLSEFLENRGCKDAVLKKAVLYNIETIKDITSRMFQEDSNGDVYYKKALKLQFYSMCTKLPQDLKTYLESIIDDAKKEASDDITVLTKEAPIETGLDAKKMTAVESAPSETSVNKVKTSDDKNVPGEKPIESAPSDTSVNKLKTSNNRSLLGRVASATTNKMVAAVKFGTNVAGGVTKWSLGWLAKGGSYASAYTLNKAAGYFSNTCAKTFLQVCSSFCDAFYCFVDALGKGESWSEVFNEALQGEIEGLDKVDWLREGMDDAMKKAISVLKKALSNTTSNLEDSNTDSKMTRFSMELGASLNELCDNMCDELVSLKFSEKIKYIADLLNTFNNIYVLQKMYSTPVYHVGDNSSVNKDDIASPKFLGNKEIETISKDLAEYLYNTEFIDAERIL